MNLSATLTEALDQIDPEQYDEGNFLVYPFEELYELVTTQWSSAVNRSVGDEFDRFAKLLRGLANPDGHDVNEEDRQFVSNVLSRWKALLEE